MSKPLTCQQCNVNLTHGANLRRQNFTIFRARRGLEQSKKNLLEPSVISIGPFHHGETSLQPMEEKKWQFLRDFLSCGDHLNLDRCISEMKQLEEKARSCYSETVDLDSHAFVEMMLLDGCFVLEYFLKQSQVGWLNFYGEFGWNYFSVLTDLRVLENQIPLFVVEKLCEIGLEQEERNSFFKELICILSRGPTEQRQIVNPPTEIHHLVHFFHHFSVPNYPIEPVVLRCKSFHLTRIKDLLRRFLSWVLPRRFSGSISRSSSLAFPNFNRTLLVIPCASELQDAGIKFRPKSNPRHMLDISFVRGVLEIPRQFISCTTKPLLTNLIAFEQNKVGQMHTHLTSFLLFLNYLVNTQKDVMILQQCGIIQNILSSEEELTNFFNQVGDGLTYSNNHFLAELFKKVNIYCESSWNRHRAKLVRDYFSNPWAAISLIAALVLLVFTFVQSFFAVYAYFVPPSS